jgi:GT2 family glycosyltransferase
MALQKKVVPILCMHRSGSSMVANLLQRLGMSLGPFELLGPSGDNIYGHFEAMPFYRLDQELQQHVFGFTEDIPPTEPLFSLFCKSRALWQLETRAVPPELIDRGFSLVKTLTAGNPVSGFKDPRVPLLWPFWEKIFRSFQDVETIPLVILRSPHEVAMSIFTRCQGRWTYQQALDVAAVHYERIEDILRSWQGQHLVVRYVNDLLQQDLRQAVECLGLTWDEGIFHQAYDSGCKHHEPAAVSHKAQMWFDRLARLGDSKPDLEQLKRIEADAGRREELLRSKVRQLHSQTDAQQQEQERLAEMLRLSQDECEQEKNKQTQTLTEIQELRTQADQRQLDFARLHSQALEHQAQVSALREELTRGQEQNAQLTREVQAGKDSCEQLTLALRRDQETLQECRTKNEQQQEALQQAHTAADECHLQIRRLRAKLHKKVVQLGAKENEAALHKSQQEVLERTCQEKLDACARLQDELASSTKQVRRLQDAVVDRDEKIERAAVHYRGELASLQSNVRQLQDAVADRDATIEQAAIRHRGDLDSLQNKIQRLEADLADRNEKIGQLSKQSNDWEQRTRQLSDQTNYWEQCVSKIHESTSWRITKPLRVVSEAVQGLRKMPGNHALVPTSGLNSLRTRFWYGLHLRKIARQLAESGLFDADWYRDQYPDVAQSKMTPLRHYLAHGRREGRRPAPWFDADWYLSANPDVAAAGIDPFLHYCLHGVKEGRVPKAAVLTPPCKVLDLPQSDAAPPSADNLVSLADTVKLPTSSQPVISVIIPAGGKCDYTLRCLASMVKHPPATPFEVLVIDDCAPDNTAEVMRRVDGVRLISNPQNLGFIRTCNKGAKLAKGEYLCFLNNDIEVTPGWLDELYRTFHDFPNTGLVGSKLLNADGTLQEAGGIIWQDGSAWNFGRNQDPSFPAYNYTREVDYCSGASIMVPKKLFDELQGFDEYYLPAYCEDSDLALRIRNRGYRVLYQPLSVVYHFEGIVHGRDTNQGVKAHQVENQKKLLHRWNDRLQRHQAPGVDVDRAKDRMAKRRVLVMDHCTPTPNQDAGSVTSFNMMLLLREMDFQVTFIPEDNFLYMPDYTPELQRLGIEVIYGPYCNSVENHLKEYGPRYDLALLFRPDVIDRHLKKVRQYCPQAKVLYHAMDLYYLRWAREAELKNDASLRQAAEKMKEKELTMIRASDASIIHSTHEIDLLRQYFPSNHLHLFPLILDIPGTKKMFQERRDIVFVGGYQHPPNVDAVLFFVNEVMPILRTRLPGVRFYAAGSKPPAAVQELAGKDVIVTGFVDDLPSLLDRMRVSVAPLRYGAGVKGKVGTAMSLGLPVVATSLAAEGMCLSNGENILVADDAESFASAIIRLYENESLWNQISRSGLEFAEKAWGAKAAYRTLYHILGSVGINSFALRDRPLKLYKYSNSFSYTNYSVK